MLNKKEIKLSMTQQQGQLHFFNGWLVGVSRRNRDGTYRVWNYFKQETDVVDGLVEVKNFMQDAAWRELSREGTTGVDDAG